MLSSVAFDESLDKCFSVGVEQLLPTFQPGGPERRRRDIPVWPASLADGAEILSKILNGRPAEKPIAVVDFVDDEAWFQHNHVRDHRIIDGVGIFRDVEVFLHDTAGVGQKRPMRTNSATIFIRLDDGVGGDGDQFAVRDLELAMQRNKSLRLPAILRTISSAAENKNERIVPL